MSNNGQVAKTRVPYAFARMTSIPNQYHLGTSADEFERLGYQHQVWLDVTVELWRDAGFSHGEHLVDLGCGPGFTTTDLAHRQ